MAAGCLSKGAVGTSGPLGSSPWALQILSRSTTMLGCKAQNTPVKHIHRARSIKGMSYEIESESVAGTRGLLFQALGCVLKPILGGTPLCWNMSFGLFRESCVCGASLLADWCVDGWQLAAVSLGF